jgi:hypothetical protein
MPINVLNALVQNYKWYIYVYSCCIRQCSGHVITQLFLTIGLYISFQLTDAGACTHAAVHPMSADAQAGGDHPHPFRLLHTWGPLRPRGLPLHAPAFYVC